MAHDDGAWSIHSCANGWPPFLEDATCRILNKPSRLLLAGKKPTSQLTV